MYTSIFINLFQSPPTPPKKTKKNEIALYHILNNTSHSDPQL